MQSQLASLILTLILYINVTALFLRNKQLAGGGSGSTATSKMEHIVIIVLIRVYLLLVDQNVAT